MEKLDHKDSVLKVADEKFYHNRTKKDPEDVSIECLGIFHVYEICAWA